MARRLREAVRGPTWILSPALVTILFFAVQLLISLTGARSSTGVAGLAPQTPQAVRGERIVQPIQPADPVRRVVPATEAELFELLERHRSVRFTGQAQP